MTATDYYAFGAIDPTPRNWYSWSANGTVSKLLGSHTFKAGADWRTIGIKTQSFTGGVRHVLLRPLLHLVESPFGQQRRTAATRWRRCCSAIPRATPATRARVTVSSPFNAFTHYWGAVSAGRLARQPEVHPELRRPPRTRRRPARREQRPHRWLRSHAESRRRARQRRQPADRPADSSAAWSTPASTALTNTRATRRRSSSRRASAWSTRSIRRRSSAAATASTGRRGTTRPSAPANYGNVGFTQQTFINAEPVRPDHVADQSVPAGHRRRRAAAAAARSKASAADRVHRPGQEGAADSPVLGGPDARVAAATSRSASNTSALLAVTSASAARTTASSTSTRCRLSTFARPGAARPGAEPVLRSARRAGQERDERDDSAPRAAASVPAVQRHPDAPVDARQEPVPRRVLKFEKRMSNGWGGRVNYTYSRLKDNQFGETNFFSNTAAEMQDVDITGRLRTALSTLSACSTCRTS